MDDLLKKSKGGTPWKSEIKSCPRSTKFAVNQPMANLILHTKFHQNRIMRFKSAPGVYLVESWWSLPLEFEIIVDFLGVFSDRYWFEFFWVYTRNSFKKPLWSKVRVQLPNFWVFSPPHYLCSNIWIIDKIQILCFCSIWILLSVSSSCQFIPNWGVQLLDELTHFSRIFLARFFQSHIGYFIHPSFHGIFRGKTISIFKDEKFKKKNG